MTYASETVNTCSVLSDKQREGEASRRNLVEKSGLQTKSKPEVKLAAVARIVQVSVLESGNSFKIS